MRAILAAAVGALALVVVHLVLGGASFAPAEVADPCVTRTWREPERLEKVVEQIVLSGLDGAACELKVAREEIVLAFAGRGSLARLAREHGISEVRLEALVRSALIRAIDDAERARALDAGLANLFRGLVVRIPIASLLDLIEQLPGL